jgi:hypothetical protein
MQVYELANLRSNVMMDGMVIKTDFCGLIYGLYFVRLRHLRLVLSRIERRILDEKQLNK